VSGPGAAALCEYVVGNILARVLARTGGGFVERRHTWLFRVIGPYLALWSQADARGTEQCLVGGLSKTGTGAGNARRT